MCPLIGNTRTFPTEFTEPPSYAELRSAEPPKDTWSERCYLGVDECARGAAVIIQNVPGSVGVQRHITQLITFYSTRFNVKKCYVDGACGEPGFYHIEEMPDELRELFFEKQIYQAYISGAELFCIQHPEIDCDLYGVETPSLYLIQAQAAVLLHDSGRQFNRIGKRALSSFMKGLRAPADFAKVAGTIVQLLECLGFNRKWVDLTELSHIATNYGISTEHINDHARIAGQDDLDNLLKSLLFAWELEDSIALQLKITGLARLHQLLALSSPAFNLSLPCQLQPFVTTVGQALRTGEILDQARIASKNWGLDKKWLQAVETLAGAWSLPNTYYYYATRRSKAMADNIAVDMKERGTSVALVVVAGFHCAEIARWLWENHRIRSVTVQPRLSSLADGMMLPVRIICDERQCSYAKGLIQRLPYLIWTYGPFAVLRYLIKLGRADLRLRRARQRMPTDTDHDDRTKALREILKEFSDGIVLLVDTADVPLPAATLSSADEYIISADLFTYYVGTLDIQGERWKWKTQNFVDSHFAAVCCYRDYLPLRNSSVDDVVWLPRFLRIREIDRAKALFQMIRSLRPGGKLHVWLREDAQDASMRNAIEAIGNTSVELSKNWLVARKLGEPTQEKFPQNESVAEPIVNIRVLHGNRNQLATLIAAELKKQGLTTLCQRGLLSGLHEDLADPRLGLYRPDVNETLTMLQRDLDDATRSATLVLLVANRSLLDLAGGPKGLRQMLKERDWRNHVFVLVEDTNDRESLAAGAYFCSDIVNALATDGKALTETIRDALHPLYNSRFSPRLPKMLLRYLGCPKCPDHPSLSVQINYMPPRHSDGVLVCKTCKTAFHIRNGVPEITSLSEMGDFEFD